MPWGRDNVSGRLPSGSQRRQEEENGGILTGNWASVGLKKRNQTVFESWDNSPAFEQTLVKIKSRNLYLIKKKNNNFVSKLLKKEEKEVRLFFSFFFPSKYLHQKILNGVIV